VERGAGRAGSPIGWTRRLGSSAGISGRKRLLSSVGIVQARVERVGPSYAEPALEVWTFKKRCGD